MFFWSRWFWMDDDGCKWCKWETSGNIDFHNGFLTSRWSQGSTTAFPQRKWILWQRRRVARTGVLWMVGILSVCTHFCSCLVTFAKQGTCMTIWYHLWIFVLNPLIYTYILKNIYILILIYIYIRMTEIFFFRWRMPRLGGAGMTIKLSHTKSESDGLHGRPLPQGAYMSQKHPDFSILAARNSAETETKGGWASNRQVNRYEWWVKKGHPLILPGLVMTNSSPWFFDGPNRHRWFTELRHGDFPWC